MDATPDERLREELAHYSRVAYQRGLVSGTGGNLSVRLDDPTKILITPSAISKRESSPDELIVVDLEGRKVAGPEGMVASKEVHLHTAVYRARPHVRAIAHLHSPSCIVFAIRSQPIPLVTVTAEARLGFTPVVPEAPSGSQELADVVHDALVEWPDARLVVLERHGVLAVGTTLREAIDVADLAEDTARVALQVAAAGATVRTVIDVSVPDHPGMHHYPGDPILEQEQVRAIARGDVANLTYLQMGAHTGTHVDAPSHFIDGGPTLDQVALDRMIGEAVVIDVRGRRAVDAAALAQAPIPPGAIVLLKTDNSALWDRPGFQEGFTYLTLDGAELLLERRVRTVGIDYLSIEQFGSRDFAVHKRLLGEGVLIVEGLNLGAVEAGTYTFVCLPLALQGVDGAPARAVLMR